MHGEGLPAGFYADNDVSGARLEVVGLLIGDAILLLDEGCENVAVPGVDGFGVERVQHIDGRVRGVAGWDHKDLRLQRANIPVAIGIEVAMVVSDGYTNRAAHFGGGRFGVAPRLETAVETSFPARTALRLRIREIPHMFESGTQPVPPD